MVQEEEYKFYLLSDTLRKFVTLCITRLKFLADQNAQQCIDYVAVEK